MAIFGSTKSEGESVSVEAETSATDVPVSGMVLKAFSGANRRFPVGYVVTDADAADLPQFDLKAGGFIA